MNSFSTQQKAEILSGRHGLDLRNQDCIELMASFPDKYFDLAIVDPPYGIGMDNQTVRTKPNRPNTYIKGGGTSQYDDTDWDSQRPDSTYFQELFRVSSHQIIWGSNYFNSMLPDGFGFIYWDKKMGDNSFSSGEIAFCSLQIKASCFSFPSMRVAGTRIHPTQKPVELYHWLLDKYAKPGMRILDTHLGSAASAIACYDRGYSLIGSEISSIYYPKLIDRVFQHIVNTPAQNDIAEFFG